MKSWNEIKSRYKIRGFDEGHVNVTISREGLLFFIGLLHKNFDEIYYLNNNEDVKDAVDSGQVSSAFEHYIHFGYYESRFPGFNEFNPTEYLDANQDLEFLRNFDDAEDRAREHFRQHGFNEGRRTKL